MYSYKTIADDWVVVSVSVLQGASAASDINHAAEMIQNV